MPRLTATKHRLVRWAARRGCGARGRAGPHVAGAIRRFGKVERAVVVLPLPGLSRVRAEDPGVTPVGGVDGGAGTAGSTGAEGATGTAGLAGLDRRGEIRAAVSQTRGGRASPREGITASYRA